MMTSDDKVGGWVKKGQNHDDAILEWSLFQLEGGDYICPPLIPPPSDFHTLPWP